MLYSDSTSLVEDYFLKKKHDPMKNFIVELLLLTAWYIVNLCLLSKIYVAIA